MNHSEQQSQAISNQLQRLQRHLIGLLGVVWLVTILIVGAMVAYLVFLTGQAAWLLLVGGILLLGVLVMQWATRIVRQYVFQLLERFRLELDDITQNIVDQLPVPNGDNDDRPIDHENWTGANTLILSSSVSKREWSARELSEIQEEFGRLTESEFDGIIIHHKVKILGASQSLAAMFGYELSEVIDRTVLELVVPEARSLVLKHTVLKHKKPYEVIGLKKNGTMFPIEIVCCAVPYQGYITRVMAIRTITGRKQEKILEALRKAKDELKEKVGESTSELRSANEQLRYQLRQQMRMEAEIKARARQQEAVAELGQRALVGTNLSALMDDAISLVAQTLQVAYAEILEKIPGTDSLLLRAGVGWQEELLGRATVSVNNDSQAGYTLLSRGPVIVEDLRTETRFSDSTLLNDAHVVSGMSVIIQGRDQPLGVLAVHTTGQRTFNEDNVHFLQAFANVLAMAIERKRTETQIIRRNRELLTLQSAGTAITSSLDLQYVLNTVTREMVHLLEVEACTISQWDQTANTVSLLAKHHPKDWEDAGLSEKSLNLADYPSIKQVLVERFTRQMRVNQPNVPPAELGRMQAANIKFSLLLPMIFQERVVGLAQIMDRTERTLSDQEVSLAQLLANQAASAIENARLYADTRKILKEQIALRQACAAISSTLDLETVLSQIATQMGLMVDLTSAYIFGFEPEEKVSTVLAKYLSPQACVAEQTPDLGTVYNLERDFAGTIRFLQVDSPKLPTWTIRTCLNPSLNICSSLELKRC